jgi:hypothetical protein
MRLCITQIRMTAGTSLLGHGSVGVLNHPTQRQALLRLPCHKNTVYDRHVCPSSIRCMASSRNNEDKSWAELAGDDSDAPSETAIVLSKPAVRLLLLPESLVGQICDLCKEFAVARTILLF